MLASRRLGTMMTNPKWESLRLIVRRTRIILALSAEGAERPLHPVHNSTAARLPPHAHAPPTDRPAPASPAPPARLGRWVYDFEEFQAVARVAGIPASAVTHSTRMGADLPADFRAAIEQAGVESTARRQRGARENPTRCWLEQEVREPETLYVTVIKPRSG